ncbi:MAG: carboxypeptidase-like regulatory domain-containing protein [Bacteroidetes bacterium]|nr:carboxypeptidase-like regulatory domain-containing protein [Bacteroidota bacterium]
MTNVETAKYKAYKLALAHLANNEAITNEEPVFASAYQAAKALLDRIDAAESMRTSKVTATTATRNDQRKDLAEITFSVAAVMKGYAEKAGDTALRNAMSLSRGEVFGTTPLQLSTVASNILAQAQKLLEPLKAHGMNESLLADFAAQLEQFNTGNAPRNFIAERKQAGQLVSDNLRSLTDLFNGQLDGMMLLFKDKYPDFYAQYLIKRAVVNPARRKTRVEGVVTDKAGGSVLAGVLVSLKGTSATTLTATDGSYYLNAQPAVPLVILFEKEGYKPLEVTVIVKRGQALLQNAALEK